MFDERDKELIKNELIQLWPTSKSITKKEFFHWCKALEPYTTSQVIEALGYAKREREQTSRPTIKQVKNYCSSLKREVSSREKNDSCPWCDGRWLIQVVLYFVRWPEKEKLNIPNKFCRTTRRSDNLYVVMPEVARAHGLKQTSLNVYCGRCKPKLGVMSFLELHQAYDRYFEYENQQSRGVAENLLSNEVPMPEETQEPWQWRQAWQRGEFNLAENEERILRGSVDIPESPPKNGENSPESARVPF